MTATLTPTLETVMPDRAILRTTADAVSCKPLTCWYCSTDASEPFMLGNRRFCCRACAMDYAE